MIWHDIRDPQDPQLDELARKYNLHPLHMEDCRNRNQSAKVEQMNEYLFIVLQFPRYDKQLGRLSPRVAAADRPKIEAHLAALHTLEKRLSASRVAACSPPRR